MVEPQRTLNRNQFFNPIYFKPLKTKQLMKGYVITLVIVVLGVLIATRVEKAIAKKA